MLGSTIGCLLVGKVVGEIDCFIGAMLTGCILGMVDGKIGSLVWHEIVLYRYVVPVMLQVLLNGV